MLLAIGVLVAIGATGWAIVSSTEDNGARPDDRPIRSAAVSMPSAPARAANPQPRPPSPEPAPLKLAPAAPIPEPQSPNRAPRPPNRGRRSSSVEPGPAPSDPFQLALYYQRAGDFEQALLHYKAALLKDEMNVEAHNNLGGLYLGRNLLDEAAREFQRGLAIAPGYAPARINLSAALYRLGRFDAAAAQAREALRLDPRNVDAFVNLSLAQKASGQPSDAQASLRRALELDPRHALAHYNLARQYEDGGETVRAVEHYRQFLQYAGPEQEPYAADVRARLQSLQARPAK